MFPLPIFALRSVPGFLGWRRAPDTESIRNEHTAAKGFAGRMMDRWLQWEQGRVAALKSIWTGSSCVIVGRKDLVDQNTVVRQPTSYQGASGLSRIMPSP